MITAFMLTLVYSLCSLCSRPNDNPFITFNEKQTFNKPTL